MYENDDESETWWRGVYWGEAVHNLSVLELPNPKNEPDAWGWLK